MNGSFSRWRGNFYTGLALVLPAVISIAIVKWLFGTVSNITDTLLFFLPYVLKHKYVYANGVSGEMLWYWSFAALVFAIFVIAIIGRLARNFMGQKLIEMVDSTMLRVPLLNKIYGAIKQVNEAFTSNSSSFKQVVMVEFPRDGIYSVGFMTGEQHEEVQAKLKERVVSVFVPTTPNPTSGFLMLVPESKVVKLDMSVAEGIKFIISLGSVSPEYVASVTGGKVIRPPAVSAAQPVNLVR